ncbi:MAG: DRTGG domain-containing protein [Chloroflexota bacterium]
MNLEQIIHSLNLKVLTTPKPFHEIHPTTGYAADLLSCVMTGASRGGLWVTLQSHTNIVAVAALLELCAVIITEGAQPDEMTIRKADEEGIALLSSQEDTYRVVGRLWELGIR